MHRAHYPSTHFAWYTEHRKSTVTNSRVGRHCVPMQWSGYGGTCWRSYRRYHCLWECRGFSVAEFPIALVERVTERTYRTSAAFPRSWIECLSHSMLPMYIHFSMTHLIPRECRQHWSTALTSDQLFLRSRVRECVRKHFVILLGFENRGQYLFVTLTEFFCHCLEYVHSVLF